MKPTTKFICEAPAMSHINALKEELRKQKAITEMWYEQMLFYKWCFHKLPIDKRLSLVNQYEVEVMEVNFERE